MAEFAERVKVELKRFKWGAYDLARATGLSPQGIDRLLKGEREPSLATAAKIAQALSVSLDVLAGLREPRKKK